MEYLDCTAGTNGNFYHLSLVTKEQELKTVRTCDKLYMLMSCWILWNLSNIFITPFSWSSRKYVSLWHIYLQQIWQGPFTGFMTYIFRLLIVFYIYFSLTFYRVTPWVQQNESRNWLAPQPQIVEFSPERITPLVTLSDYIGLYLLEVKTTNRGKIYKLVD